MAGVNTGVGVVTVRELTVAEVRAWLKDLAALDADGEIDLADWLLFEGEGLRLADFQRMTDLAARDLDALTPSELEAVLACCREVNPRFFSVHGRVLAMGRQVLSRPSSTPSNAPARGWRTAFARMFGRGPGAA